MREIKFRAWRRFANEMLDWQVISKNKYGHTLLELLNKENNTFSDSSLRSYDLIFMQFTGLTDKNGKEIYEFDLVRFVNAEEGYDKIHLIEWKHNGFLVNGWTLHLESPNTTAEVVGNIYQTPELLEKTNERN